MGQFYLEMRDITKVFPGVVALDKVNVQVKKGEIHAICGENGAGKSTLIKVLCGVYPYLTYDGEIMLDGEVQKFYKIKDAEDKGIVCIHQELALVPELSIGENIFLGNEPNKYGVIQWDEIYYNTSKLLSRIGLSMEESEGAKASVNPNEKIKNLGIGQKQLVEIAKALAKNAKLLILDEPTAALTENEVDILLSILRTLKNEGVTCIYISHKLDEVLRIADTVTVFRDGKTVGTKSINEIDKNTIISMMVGRELTNIFPREKHIRGELGFEIRDYTVYNPDIPDKKIIDNVSFKAYKGEILGISGLMGSGRTELFTSIFGAYPARATGEVFIDGKKVDIKDPLRATKNGYALVSEDRKRYGLNMEMNVMENTTLASLDKVSKYSILNENIEIYETNRFVSYLRTKTPSIETKVKNLSGGNQQKVVLAKSLMIKPKVLVMDEPTRGIDVGAKYEIYKIMNQLVAQGVIIIMISSELEEILGMSDRILVFSEGKLKAEMDISEASQEKIMFASTGGVK
jgi:ABC-type sugar transport system ATPase subunit